MNAVFYHLFYFLRMLRYNTIFLKNMSKLKITLIAFFLFLLSKDKVGQISSEIVINLKIC